MTLWYQVKLFIEHSSAFSPDALHVFAGVAIQLLTAAVLRRPVSRWAPWLVVLVAIIVNEAIDLWVERWPQPGMQYGEGAKDVLLTMILPTMLLLVARLRPRLLVGGGRR